MPYAHLSDRSILALSGEERIAFLQGLITNDAAALSHGNALYAALLSPQGKFLHDFFLIPHNDTVLIDVHKDREADLLARLSLYKLRAKVSLSPLPDMKVMAVWDAHTEPHALTINDPRVEKLGKRIYGDANTLQSNIEVSDYESHRIRLGIPDGAKDMLIDTSLPMEFGLDRLHGISFSKGCYVGQEVTARSKFRGQVRKSLYIVSAEQDLPTLGTEINGGEKVVGTLRSVSGKYGIALLKTEELEKTNAPLQAGNIPLHHRLPEWATS